jgi:8-oxo-dGTP diphosphatase
MKKASCILLIDEKNKLFLSVSLKTDKTDFNLPGGKVEKGETFKQAAIREMKEETGLDILEKDLIIFQTDFVDGYKVITFLITKYTNQIYTEEEGIVMWLPYIHLTKSKSWKKENSNLYYKLIKH